MLLFFPCSSCFVFCVGKDKVWPECGESSFVCSAVAAIGLNAVFFSESRPDQTLKKLHQKENKKTKVIIIIKKRNQEAAAYTSFQFLALRPWIRQFLPSLAQAALRASFCAQLNRSPTPRLFARSMRSQNPLPAPFNYVIPLHFFISIHPYPSALLFARG